MKWKDMFVNFLIEGAMRKGPHQYTESRIPGSHNPPGTKFKKLFKDNMATKRGRR